MGAVTAIMYGDRDPSIAGMVLDSPFSSLKKLVEELVKDKVNLPNFVINQALKLVKSTVQKKANFKLDDIEPIQFAERCYIPALFVAANNDNFVKPHHAKILHDVYPGDKNLVNIDGDHNSHRPRFFKDSATIFFYNTLQVQYIKEISDNYAGYYKKKNDIFEDEKKDVNENKNANNIAEKNDLISNNVNKNNNNNNKKGNSVPQVSSDANLNNIDFEGIEDEEEILRMILEKSRKDFEEIELKNENNLNKIEIENNNNSNYLNRYKDNILFENNQNFINIESNNNKETNNNRILLNEFTHSTDKNNLFDFLNSQIKTNNKDNVKEIKSNEPQQANKEKEQNFYENDYNFRDNTYENKSRKNDLDLINDNFEDIKGKTERTEKK